MQTDTLKGDDFLLHFQNIERAGKGNGRKRDKLVINYQKFCGRQIILNDKKQVIHSGKCCDIRSCFNVPDGKITHGNCYTIINEEPHIGAITLAEYFFLQKEYFCLPK